MISPPPTKSCYRLPCRVDARAQSLIGSIYREGLGVPKNDAEAVKWYRKAAQQGHVMAQVYLGFMYDNGYGVPENDAEALKWYRKAADQGDAYAQNNLALMYKKGGLASQKWRAPTETGGVLWGEESGLRRSSSARRCA